MMYQRFKTPEEALENWFNESRNRLYHREGSIHIWQDFPATWCNIRAGSYQSLTRKQLEGRIYTVHWHDAKVGISFHDAINLKSAPLQRENYWHNDSTVRFPFI